MPDGSGGPAVLCQQVGIQGQGSPDARYAATGLLVQIAKLGMLAHRYAPNGLSEISFATTDMESVEARSEGKPGSDNPVTCRVVGRAFLNGYRV